MSTPKSNRTFRHMQGLTIYAIMMLCLPLMHGTAQAQNRSTVRYDKIAQDITEYIWNEKAPEHINYDLFKLLYLKTPYYDPHSGSILKLINDIAKEIHTAHTNKDNEKVKRLQVFYREIMTTQAANFSAVNHAWYLSRQSAIFGSHKFWNSLRGEIFAPILNSGDGKSARSAYEINTFDEEKYLLEYLNYEVKDTLDYQRYGFDFHVHSVINRTHNIPLEIYVNITKPKHKEAELNADKNLDSKITPDNELYENLR